MADYVSRQYLLNEYDRQHQGPPGGARKIIAEAPAEDVVLAAHGRWIVSHIPDSMLWECDRCGFDCGAHSFNFCPNCGAKMDVEEIELIQKKNQEEIWKEKEEAIIFFIIFSVFIFILCGVSIIIN